MSTGLSPRMSSLLNAWLPGGFFTIGQRRIDEAVELLRRRQELLDHIDQGTRQLRSGEGIEIRGEEELRAFFDGIQAEGMRHQQSKNAP